MRKAAKDICGDLDLKGLGLGEPIAADWYDQKVYTVEMSRPNSEISFTLIADEV